MREEPGQTCTESTNNSSNISDSKESLMSVIDHTNMSAEAGDNKPQSTNEFDDSCFKTPELPNRNRRKLGVRMNGHINELSSCTNGSRVKTEPIDSLKKLTLDSDNTSKTLDSNDADETKPSIEDLCELKPSTSSLSDVSETRSQSPLKSPTKTSSAKGSSYTCPHTKKFLSTAFPKLPAKSLSDKELDLLNEIIIDEFSLLVFRSLDDYKVFKVEEDEKIAREKLLADEAKRKADEPIISTTPCAKNNNMIKKKVGRKSKAEKAREEEERRRLKAERKEQRKRERREHRLREKRELKAKGLLPKRKEKRTEEEKQRHLEEKQRQKEEKRLEKERLREEKRQLKRQLKTSTIDASTAGPFSSAAAFCTANAANSLNHQAAAATPVIVAASSSQPYSGLMMKNTGSATIDNLIIASTKRPPSEIGDLHRNGGVIFPPSATPPAAKMPRLDDSLEEYKKHQLIGIAIKSENNFDQNITPPSGVVANGLTKNHPLSTLDLKPLNGAQLPNDPANRLAALTRAGLIGPHTTSPSTAGSNPTSLERLSTSSSLNIATTSSTTSSLSSISASQDLRALTANQALAAMYGGGAGLPPAEIQAALMNHPEFAAHCRQAYAALASTGTPMHSLLMPGIGLPAAATPGFPAGFPATLFGSQPQLFDQQRANQQNQQQLRQQQLNNATAQRAAGQPTNGLPPMLGSASTSSLLGASSTASTNSTNTQALAAAGLGSYPSIGMQFPPGASLGSQLAGAALLSAGMPGLSAPPAKTSRWCNMHVLIAEAVLRKKENLKNNHAGGVSVSNHVNRAKTPPRSNIPSSANSTLPNSATQLNHFQKNTSDPRLAQLSHQHQQQLSLHHQQQQQHLLAQRQQQTAASLMQPPTSKPAQQQQQPPQLAQQQRTTIQQSPQQQQQQSSQALAAQYQQAMFLQSLQQQQAAMAASNALTSTTMASAASTAASLAQQQARKNSQVLANLQQIQANNPLMSHFGLGGLQPGITSGIPPNMSMLTSHQLVSQEMAKAAGRASATPKQLNSVQQARPPSSINHQVRAASTAPSVAAAAALHPALGAIGLQQQANAQLGGIPAGFPIAPPLGPSGSITNGTSDAAVQAMLAAALSQNPAASSANAAALVALISQATGGNNLSAMQHQQQQQQQLVSQASSVSHLLHGANPTQAMNQTAQHQRPQEQQALAAALLQQVQMLEKQHQLQGLGQSAIPNGMDIIRQMEQQHILQQLQQHQLLDRYSNANLLASALQQPPAASSSAEQSSSVALPNGLHNAFEQELIRQRLASQLRPGASVPVSSATGHVLHGLGQNLHQNHTQQNLDLALLEQLQRQQQQHHHHQQQQQQQQQAMLGRSMLGAGLAPTAPSPAPSMMFNPAAAAQLMGMSNSMAAAQLYGKMNPAMNAAAAAGKRDN